MFKAIVITLAIIIIYAVCAAGNSGLLGPVIIMTSMVILPIVIGAVWAWRIFKRLLLE